MRRLLPLVLLGLSAFVGMPASAEDASVETRTGPDRFVPSTVTIDPGDTVTWTNGGGAHRLKSSSGNWSKEADLLTPGSNTSATFNHPDNYTYYCEIHGTPTSGMRGTVVVRAPSPTPTSKSPTPKPTTPRPSASTSPPASSSPEPTSTRTSGSPSPAASSPVPSPTGPSATLGPRPSFLTGAPTAPESPDTISIGEGGLGIPDPSGRERGLPIALAVVTLGGVVTAQVRTLLSVDR